MHLRSLTLKGFKSFPNRTQLEFGPGVAVIIGPNGSGKSNITDAVLWALGEQSPLAIRGQTMQDVIFAGGHGVASRNEAEVEVVIDNSDGGLNSAFSDISITRFLTKDGDSGYRLNGARCRLIDIAEVLSDSGLGKEMHSVVSQGRVEAIIHSKPRDRRLLIEEAAGLGKHRKRRRRAQLKLERTEENLSRALDVEREARSRLKPLKRQAEAAELHERLERQSHEARYELARERVRAVGEQLAGAERAAAVARAERDQAERLLTDVAKRREAAEEAFAAHSRDREALSSAVFAARSAADRISLRAERAREVERSSTAAIARRKHELEAVVELLSANGGEMPVESARVEELEAELRVLDAERERRLEIELAELSAERDRAEAARAAASASADRLKDQLARAEAAAAEAREQRRLGERAAADARSESAAVAAELAAVNRFLASASSAVGGMKSLADDLDVDPGYEAALSAVLGSLMRAGIVSNLAEGAALLDRNARDGGVAVVDGGIDRSLSSAPARSSDHSVNDLEPGGIDRSQDSAPARSSDHSVNGVESGGIGRQRDSAPVRLSDHSANGVESGEIDRSLNTAPARSSDGSVPRSPTPGAEPLLAHVRPGGRSAEIVKRLLQHTFLVESLNEIPRDFTGTAVTKSGRVYDGATQALRQAAPGGEEKILAERNRREQLNLKLAAAQEAEKSARNQAAQAQRSAQEADEALERSDRALRNAFREAEQAGEAVRRAEWLIERRREAPDEGPAAVSRARIEAEIAAERRMGERAAREQRERALQAQRLRSRIERGERVAAAAATAALALEKAVEVVGARQLTLAEELTADQAVGERTAAELRGCAQEEVSLQARLRKASEAVTTAEVAAQQVRDAAAEAQHELDDVATKLGLSANAADEPLDAERQLELQARIERLARRRESLGPVNPLAKQEYDEAIAHVEELEAQRGDLEAALTELKGLIKETDRRIRESFEETFEAAAENFEEVVKHLFPGGRGRLRLVHPEGPRAVIGGEAVLAGEAVQPDGEEPDVDQGGAPEPGEPGVEVEVTPAGKTMKRLSLMSGGEKSLVALAFMFAVFLARPCPFYILDEVEAALDDPNIDRFLQLIAQFSDRAQFVVVTHQKRTMDAADTLYGVSMGADGVSRVVSRRLTGAGVDSVSEDGAAPSPPAVEAA
jgi:chromosome segregation protein